MNNLGDEHSGLVSDAKIKVIGIGGAGSNSLNTMISENLEGVEFIAVNTDSQTLSNSLASKKVQIGCKLTNGLGAGANPDIGRESALENKQELQTAISNSDMVFITAGMGGGTGTGASPVIAQIAKETDALTIAIVTLPFSFEGKKRIRQANQGINSLRNSVDTLIVVPNQQLLQVASADLTMINAFKLADSVLLNAVKGISNIINKPGIINVDFADIKTIMSNMGQAVLGVGSARGENRAVKAAQNAISSPLLEDLKIDGATGILINITAGPDLTILEISQACSIVEKTSHDDANIIFGTVIDENLKDEIQVTVIATGLQKISDNFEFKDREDKSDIKIDKKNEYYNNIDSQIEELTSMTLDNSSVEDKSNDHDLSASDSIEDDLSDISPKKDSSDMLENLEQDDLDIPAFIRKGIKSVSKY